MERRPLRSATLGLLALSLVACAHTSESVTVQDRVVVAVDTPPPAPVELPPNAFADNDVAQSRPRLSRTITLGQGESGVVYGTQGAPPPAAGSGNSTNVTVNNHVTVVQQPPIYTYGYGYGYGYGSAGYGNGGRATGSASDGRTTTQPSTTGPWAPSGWEGAGRTAPAGGTPAVGGNFAPAPSFGPRQMK